MHSEKLRLQLHGKNFNYRYVLLLLLRDWIIKSVQTRIFACVAVSFIKLVVSPYSCNVSLYS